MAHIVVWILRIVLCAALSLNLLPQANANSCPDFTDGTEYSAKLAKVIQKSSSCKIASELFDACRQGSTIDLDPGDAAIRKCESEFLEKLSPSEHRAYMNEGKTCMQLWPKSQQEGGTLAMSEAKSCQVKLARSYRDRHGGQR